jgi:hypothetical protein
MTTPKKVYVVHKGADLYWQDSPPSAPCWSWITAKYTKVWKTRAGAERFLKSNPSIGKIAVVEEVTENLPRMSRR